MVRYLLKIRGRKWGFRIYKIVIVERAGRSPRHEEAREAIF